MRPGTTSGPLLVVVAGVRALRYWEVTETQKSVAAWLAKRLRDSGDAVLHGLEVELERTVGLGS